MARRANRRAHRIGPGDQRIRVVQHAIPRAVSEIVLRAAPLQSDQILDFRRQLFANRRPCFRGQADFSGTLPGHRLRQPMQLLRGSIRREAEAGQNDHGYRKGPIPGKRPQRRKSHLVPSAQLRGCPIGVRDEQELAEGSLNGNAPGKPVDHIWGRAQF